MKTLAILTTSILGLTLLTACEQSEQATENATATTAIDVDENLDAVIVDEITEQAGQDAVNAKEQEDQAVTKEVKSELKERITKEDFIVKNDIMYLPNEDKPFTGIYETYFPNGNRKGVAHIIEGKFDGLMTLWDESGQNKTVKNIKNGVDISKKEYINMTDSEKNQVKSDLNNLLNTATPEQIKRLADIVIPNK